MLYETLLEGLNEPQRAAVTLPAANALILAGAGSGKTRVLTTRIAWLIAKGQASPFGVMAVTFTNKAAREMMSRLQAQMAQAAVNIGQMWLGTFHGMANRFLRLHYREAGLSPSFQILDSQEQLSLLKRVCRSLSLDADRHPPKTFQYFINQNKDAGLRPQNIDVPDANTRRLVDVYEAYEAQCAKEGCVDFSELLLRSYELLRDTPSLQASYQAKFSHLLVDEFQDVNAIQYAWLKRMAGPSTAVFAVGDDDQSIYAFRGANLANMGAFEREFKVENLIKLEQNYRSCGHILKCANALIAHNTKRLGKNLWTSEGDGEMVRVYGAQTDQQEAQWLTAEISDLLVAGVRGCDIAVLYRSNAQSRVIEHEFFSSAIPYKVYGGQRFFERAEVKNALAYLRLIENPGDDGAFLRVANFPARGIGSRTIESLQDLAAEGSLFSAVSRMPKASKLLAFTQLIESLRSKAKALALPEVVELVISSTGLVEHYQQEREGQDRVENLRELVNAAAVFLKDPAAQQPSVGADGFSEERTAGLSVFLAHASLEAGETQVGAGDEAVQLMTVHAAKGLEFEAVFVTGLEEGVFPHEASVMDVGGADEEERRLMYVAITRGRRRLTLSHAQARMLHGKTRFHVPSRFLDELPDASLRWLSSPRRAVRSAIADNPIFHQNLSGFRVGQRVLHDHFGVGVVLGFENPNNNARVQVDFGPEGVKWLSLSIAKLEVV